MIRNWSFRLDSISTSVKGKRNKKFRNTTPESINFFLNVQIFDIRELCATQMVWQSII